MGRWENPLSIEFKFADPKNNFDEREKFTTSYFSQHHIYPYQENSFFVKKKRENRRRNVFIKHVENRNKHGFEKNDHNKCSFISIKWRRIL